MSARNKPKASDKHVYFTCFEYSQKMAGQVYNGHANCLIAVKEKLGISPDPYLPFFKEIKRYADEGDYEVACGLEVELYTDVLKHLAKRSKLAAAALNVYVMDFPRW